MWQKPISLHQLGFAPDLPSVTAGVISDADFCYPTLSGARTLPSLVNQSNQLPSICQGSFVATLSGGAINIFAGTADHLFRLIAGIWVDVSGGQIFDGEWSFEQAGDDTIATNGVSPVQVYGPLSTQFAPLGGNPPQAKFVAVVDPGGGQGFVVGLANLQSNAAGWITAGPEGDTVWTQNVNDLSASGILGGEPGPITGWKTVRTFFAAFKASALYVGAFTGPPFVWSFEPISHQIGCLSNDAIVDIGDLLVFPGPDDFYSFDGYTLQMIPNALRQWFFGIGQPGQANNGIADPRFFNTIQGHYDNSTGTVYWYFSSVNANPAGTYDMWLSWNKKSGKWLPGHTPQIAAVVNVYAKPGLTYDQFTKQYGQYENLPQLAYGDPSFGPSTVRTRAVILSNGMLATFSGVPNFGYLASGDIGDPIRFTRINRMRPFFGTYPNGNASILATYVRRNMGGLQTAFWTGIKLSGDGYFDFVQEAALHQWKMNFTADAELQGFGLDTTDAGDR